MTSLKYSVNSQELKKLYDDLYSIEDWIPQIILAYIPTEVHSKIGSKAKNNRLRVERLQKHRMEGRTINDFNDYMNWEIENFILKYPQFKKVFIEIHDQNTNIKDSDSILKMQSKSRINNYNHENFSHSSMTIKKDKHAKINGYWYNTSKKFFYVPNENKFIKITAKEALVIIDDVNLFKWNSYKIFNKTIWRSNITHKIIDIFIKEYEQGLFDDVLEWICDNNIECNNENKTDYLYSLNK